jgi:hypothetical protein
MEEMDYNLLFRWFVGLNADDDVWDATTFTKNRDRLLQADTAKEFLAQVVEQARSKGLTSDEHFTVDGTLLEAWAGAKSFQSKGGNLGLRRITLAIPLWTFAGSGGRMKRMSRRPIPRRCWRGKARARSQS